MFTSFIHCFVLIFSSIIHCSESSKTTVAPDQDFLEVLELQKAEYHKKRYGLPTPASFGVLETKTPTPKGSNNYLNTWVNDTMKQSNKLACLEEQEEAMRSLLLEEEDRLFDKLYEKEFLEKLRIASKVDQGRSVSLKVGAQLKK